MNPHLPRLRMQAAQLVIRDGWSTRQAARYTGYNQSTIVRWANKAQHTNRLIIPTESSRPYSHPNALPEYMIRRILELRRERNQCAEILHHRLIREGIVISLSSVKRVLKRNGLTRFSQWKKWHQYPERPMPEKPGILVEIDTIIDGAHTDRLYVYTLIDVCSRLAYALLCVRINTHKSLLMVEQARLAMPFNFQTIQSDHGAEFSKWFTKRITERGMAHRHSRVRTPNDNAHLERFNRTLQEECLMIVPRSLRSWQKEIPEYLRYYNEERPHMGLNMKTPTEMMQSY